MLRTAVSRSIFDDFMMLTREAEGLRCFLTSVIDDHQRMSRNGNKMMTHDFALNVLSILVCK